MVLKPDNNMFTVADNTASDGLEYRPYRGISASTMEFFKVKTNDHKQVYPYPNGTNKVRVLPKELQIRTLGSRLTVYSVVTCSL